MSRKSTITTGSTPVSQGAMVINIHIDGDVLLNLERLVINNDYLSCGGPEKAANNQHDGRAKETRDVANNEEGSEGLSDDANDSLPSHEYDAVDEIRGAASSDGGDIDDSDMDPCDTPLSPGSSIASPNPGNQFKCRLHNCDLGFINNQQREDHELWAHFLCGRCGAEYASLYLADEHREVHIQADYHLKQVKGKRPVVKHDGNDGLA